MRHLAIAKLIPLAFCIAFAPLFDAGAATPSGSGGSPSLAATSAHKVAMNGISLNGVSINGSNLNGRKASGVNRSSRRASGGGGGGMTVVSIRLPGAEHHAK